MHSDLSPHLHTPECNELINKFKECQNNNKLMRFLGYCSDLDSVMINCLRKERLARQASNSAKAEVRKKEIQERIKESYTNKK